RAIKSAREVRQVERASAIVRAAFDSVRSSTHPTEASLAAQLFYEARVRGAEDIRMMVASLRDDDWAFRPPEAVGIERGARLAIMLRASWERYWSEATRTFVARGDRLDVVGGAVLQARFDAGVERARSAGTIASWVDAAMSAAAPGGRHALGQGGFGPRSG